ncbi:MAG: 1-deoxy-D-xylulose-5-phosphate synthase [Candidatus Omnitrophica bacterium]|nr:1-deoxy-D-xylulose-5-phosphate synthase [Candidatus Omnitrophota bacterium]
MAGLLDRVNSPRDLKTLEIDELPQLADEIRALIIETVSQTGGHLAASLGAVEIAIALHYVFDTPSDFVVWDVGHQAYAHKILTGRKGLFKNLRQFGGLSGFPKREESSYDTFTVGHGSTSISTALGLVAARGLSKSTNKVIAVIGDGSLAGGMALEALNHAGHFGRDIIVILNDNEMSISPSVGAMSRYLNRIVTSPIYNRIKKDVETLMRRIPKLGFRVVRAARRLEEGLKNLLVPGIIFEELGFRYFGPIDGHDIGLLIKTLQNIKTLNSPIFLHLVTKKGKGYEFAERFPHKFHGTTPFVIETGELKLTSKGDTYTDIFSSSLCSLARENPKIVAITAAMPEGTGLDKFHSEFPDRFFNVGMAEQHAVGFASGLARDRFIPVVAIYSTFLQRSYDQIIHDVCLQNLHVVFAIDRAGIVGEDGPTHHGIFDIAYLAHMPNLVIMAPKDLGELEMMLKFAIDYNGPIAIRYPRGSGVSISSKRADIELGRAEILKEGDDIAIFTLGSMTYPCLEVRERLKEENIQASVINARFVKPLDIGLIKDISTRCKILVCVEEGVAEGGFGGYVLRKLEENDIRFEKTRIIGLPDVFIEQGRRDILFDKYGLSKERLFEKIKFLINKYEDASYKNQKREM